MAQRLLVESTESTTEVVSQLEEMAATAVLDRDRIKALWTMQGMGKLSRKTRHCFFERSTSHGADEWGSIV